MAGVAGLRRLAWGRVGAGAGGLRRRDDRGQLSVLVLGLFLIASLLILGGIDVTAAHLARVRVIDAADAAALDAADSLDPRRMYAGELTDGVAVSNETVIASAASYLAVQPRPNGIRSWRVAPGTRAVGGSTAVVVIEAEVGLPMTGGLLAGLGQSITIRAEARARAPLRS